MKEEFFLGDGSVTISGVAVVANQPTPVIDDIAWDHHGIKLAMNELPA